MNITVLFLFAWTGFNIGLMVSQWFKIPGWVVTVSMWAAAICCWVF